MCVTHLAHDVIDVIAIAMYTYADEKVVVLAPWWWVGTATFVGNSGSAPVACFTISSGTTALLTIS